MSTTTFAPLVCMSSKNRIWAFPVEPRPTDVLLGRGRTRWEGNQLFDIEIQRNVLRYAVAETRYEKSNIVREIIRTVQTWGRFLDQGPAFTQSSMTDGSEGTGVDEIPTGDWFLASFVKIRKKVGQALRYQMEVLKGRQEVLKQQSQCQRMNQSNHNVVQQQQLVEQRRQHEQQQQQLQGQLEEAHKQTQMIRQQLLQNQLHFNFTDGASKPERHVSNSTSENSLLARKCDAVFSDDFFALSGPNNSCSVPIPHQIIPSPQTAVKRERNFGNNFLEKQISGDHNPSDSDSSSTSMSLDVSLSAIVAFEESEREFGCYCDPNESEPVALLSDREILEFLGYDVPSNPNTSSNEEAF